MWRAAGAGWSQHHAVAEARGNLRRLQPYSGARQSLCIQWNDDRRPNRSPPGATLAQSRDRILGGYMAEGETRGRLLRDGVPSLRMHGMDVAGAAIEKVPGLSGRADQLRDCCDG